MREMNLREARAKLGELAEAAHHGETITLTKHGRPYALLTPLEDTVTTQQDDNDRTEYALCWESAGPDSAWVIRVRKPSMSDWDLWMSNPVEDLDEDDYQYAKQWAEECLALEEGLTVEGWKHDNDGDWIPLFAATVMAAPEHFTAWVTTDTSALDQPNADVVVLADELRGEPDDPNARSSTGSPLFSAATSVDAADGDIEDALREAAELLAKGGWRLTGKWKSVPTGCTATVERA